MTVTMQRGLWVLIGLLLTVALALVLLPGSPAASDAQESPHSHVQQGSVIQHGFDIGKLEARNGRPDRALGVRDNECDGRSVKATALMPNGNVVEKRDNSCIGGFLWKGTGGNALNHCLVEIGLWSGEECSSHRANN